MKRVHVRRWLLTTTSGLVVTLLALTCTMKSLLFFNILPRHREQKVCMDDISTCPAAPGRHFDLSCCSRTTSRRIQLLQDDMSTLAPERQLSPCLLEAVFEIVDRSLVELVFEIVFEACVRYAHFLFYFTTRSQNSATVLWRARHQQIGRHCQPH